MIDMTSVIRQEVAFLFFGLMLLVLFSKGIKPTLKKELFVLFGASMIVSHYSTAYIALALFTLTYILTLIYKIYENGKIKFTYQANKNRVRFVGQGTQIGNDGKNVVKIRGFVYEDRFESETLN